MKFSEWFWIMGKRNRKSYFFFMFLGLFALWGLFKLLGLVERSVFYQVLIYAAATQQMTFMLNVISGIFIFEIKFTSSFLERDVDTAVAETSYFFRNILIISFGDTSCDTSHSISVTSEGYGISHSAFVVSGIEETNN